MLQSEKSGLSCIDPGIVYTSSISHKPRSQEHYSISRLQNDIPYTIKSRSDSLKLCGMVKVVEKKNTLHFSIILKVDHTPLFQAMDMLYFRIGALTNG